MREKVGVFCRFAGPLSIFSLQSAQLIDVIHGYLLTPLPGNGQFSTAYHR